MIARRLAGIRARLIVIVLISTLPLFVLLINANFEQRRVARAEARADALQLARAASNRAGRLIGSTQQLVQLLAELPEVQRKDAAACSRRLEPVQALFPQYVDLGIIDPDGTVWCSARNNARAFNLAERVLFQKVAQVRDFYVGEYQISRITGGPAVTFGWPLLDEAIDDVWGVLFATLDLEWVNRLIGEGELPAESALTVVDGKGTILARYPDPRRWAGRSAAEAPVGRALLKSGAGLRGQESETMESTGVDGVRRLYAFTRFGPDTTQAFISVGIPLHAIYASANRALRNQILGLVVVMAGALATAWLMGNRLIVREVESLRAIDQLKSDFVSLVAHQLKTPVAILKGYAENLLSGTGGQTTPKQQEYLEEMVAISERNYNLIGDLLNLSRLDRGVISVELHPVPLAAIVEEALGDYRDLIERKGLRLGVSERDPGIVVLADRAKAVEALRNIVNNAAKFTRQGSIELTLRRIPGFGVVDVADTGPGMSEQTLATLFTRDRVLSGGATPEGGSGLGLYIARQFVRLQRGDMGAQSVPGQGSRFTLRLPEHSEVI